MLRDVRKDGEGNAGSRIDCFGQCRKGPMLGLCGVAGTKQNPISPSCCNAQNSAPFHAFCTDELHPAREVSVGVVPILTSCDRGA